MVGVTLGAEEVAAASIAASGAASAGFFGSVAAVAGMFSSTFKGFLTEKQLTMVANSDEKNQHGNYEIVLKYLVEKLQSTSNNETTQPLQKASILKIEKMLLKLYRKNTDLAQLESEVGCLTEDTKKIIIERILCAEEMHNIRKILMQQKFIVVVGPQNSGKSLFIQKLWGSKVKVIIGETRHTEHATAFNISDNVFVVDFPGVNSLEKYRETFSRSKCMTSILIAVIKYPGGDLDQDTVNTLMKIREVAKSSKVLKVVYCFNRCASSIGSWREEGITADSMKDHYLRQIRKYQRDGNTGTTAQVEETLPKNDFYFTDWKDSDQGRDLGIIGVDDIKEQLKHTLRKLNLINIGEL